MKAFVTSIGETTTDVCVWSLERQGFETVLIDGESTLWEKLKQIFEMADDDFIRVDADVVCNQNVMKLIEQKDGWWFQAQTFEWYRQDVGYGGVQYIKKGCFPAIRKHIDEAERMERPESYLSRLEEFHNPRVFKSVELICGVHGFKQSDTQRVKDTKMRRGQYGNYDWELANRLDTL